MKSNKIIISALFFVGISSLYGCGKTTTPPSTSSQGAIIPTSEINAMVVTVNGSLCDPKSQYLNEPCTSVTICSPGTNNCQTINNILVDTGSYGLRIFSSAISVPLNQTVDSNNNSIAECATFGIGADWGSVETADVVLGNLSLGGEKAPNVPIQVINSTFSNFQASWCDSGNIDKTPAGAGFNGILGVGLFAQDCGMDCDPTGGNDANNGMYFSCSNNQCTPSTLALNSQVTDPVTLLAQDNNGVILSLPAVGVGGTKSVSGSLILGIGTRANNTPGTVQKFQADNGTGEFYTIFNNKRASSIIDSGTNTYLFDDNLPACSSNSQFYCPSSETQFSSTMESFDFTEIQSVPFVVGNLNNFAGSNWAFSDVGVKAGDNGNFFVWGLPFFFGRNVYVGFDGLNTPLGVGPFWAY